jgi:O-antigen/teichoic acid export membrane protein
MEKDIKTIKNWVTFFGVMTIVGIVATVLNLIFGPQAGLTGLGIGLGVVGVGAVFNVLSKKSPYPTIEE